MSSVPKKKKQLSLPLLDELNLYNTSLFNEMIGYRIPEYVNNNLVHDLRDYQENSIRYFHYTQTFRDARNIKHVLFNMATGSGKTDLMAALILFMFKEYGYQNFVFTVNTNSVLNKTIDNLTSKASKKYLFQQTIEINGERISILPVTRFPIEQAKNVIYLKLATVQSLSNDLFIPSENSMSERDYARNKVVILGDEAHHYSASTKKEEDEEQTWEAAINKILNARDDNRLLEFTATIDLENKNIYEKYKDKVIYRYTLDKFMFEGFSKNVKRIEGSIDDRDKMLNVVLLSEYRRYTAMAKGIPYFKPVIMFKSQNINASNNSNQVFNEMIEGLTVEELNHFIIRQQKLDDSESSTLNYAYEYYLEHTESLPTILRTIKREFEPRRILNANDSDRGAGMLEKGQYQALNSLEDEDNLYRVIFAVAKLTEGWDVLNLYDIVRISENAKGDKKSTMAEAQLIGRGARYNPFVLNGQASYKRRLEDDSHDSLLLETLHYHTINEPQYLKNLVNSLEALDLPSGTDEKNPPLEVKIKGNFKKTDVWKYGKIYYNQTVDVPDSYYSSLSSYGILNANDVTLPWSYSSREVSYKDESTSLKTHSIVVRLNERYFKKAMQKITFYRFDVMKRFLPELKSKEEFIYGNNWLNLNNLTLRIEAPLDFTESDLTSNDKLHIVLSYLRDVEDKITKGYSSARGSNKFIGYPIKDYLTDYRKRVPKYDSISGNRSQIVEPRKMSGDENDWYVYNLAIVNELEFDLIQKIGERIKELREKYPETYLFRMDEQMNRETRKNNDLKLHQFQPTREVKFEGFQPDFILYLNNADYYIQVFIEPKGGDSGRMEREQWKEDLLTYITEHEAELIFEDEVSNVKISGLRFYTDRDGRKMFNQLAQVVLEKDHFSGMSIEQDNKEPEESELTLFDI
ncbi:type III restriction enzyme [Paenibacillus cellulosilyticus]|uniref:Type III restriction enzyme n=1 Tax=Paenibacillus cellulosilyticus TaxID=375489 RepID=A0A2V2YAU2_9BACL|nr:DEAD/DEAH box helicase family protein [Paenibacillus cellulosilyticus]PWV88455.1 type III restriction enzyme [Paenibacillus cellulosilyticus]QKS44091.1 DEAD/DEAH box helicase family protein [Paenibacillus cellulosilyticus]